MKKTALLLIVGVFIGYFLASERAKTPEFVFDDKHYFSNDSVVSISGTLTGESVGKAGPVTTKNNTVSITCYHDRMVCWTSSIDGIGGTAEQLAPLWPLNARPGYCQLGQLWGPEEYPISKWDDVEIIAVSTELFACRTVTIRIDRRRETALWIDQPTNNASMNCTQADRRNYKWTIEGSRR